MLGFLHRFCSMGIVNFVVSSRGHWSSMPNTAQSPDKFLAVTFHITFISSSKVARRCLPVFVVLCRPECTLNRSAHWHIGDFFSWCFVSGVSKFHKDSDDTPWGEPQTAIRIRLFRLLVQILRDNPTFAFTHPHHLNSHGHPNFP